MILLFRERVLAKVVSFRLKGGLGQ